MRARISRFRNELLRRVKYKVTRNGLLFAIALLLVGIAAVLSANNLLFLVLAMMLSTLLVSGFISRLCLAGLELDFQVPDHVTAGRSVAARLFVRNLKFWMPSFSVRVVAVREWDSPVFTSDVYFPVIPGGAVLEETVDVRFARRGHHSQNSFAFSTVFPFGFLEKTAKVTLRRDILVYPSVDPHPGFEELLAAVAGELETHYRGLGKDFYRIRPYEAFESARHVDWKATAHTRDLQVREFAREQEPKVEIFLDRDVPKELEDWFERAVDCCAFLAWRLSRQGAAIHFRAQDFDFRLPEEGDIYTILKYLALVYVQRGKPAEPPFDETSFQIIFSPAPQRFENLGWASVYLLGPDAFPFAAAGPAGKAHQGNSSTG